MRPGLITIAEFTSSGKWRVDRAATRPLERTRAVAWGPSAGGNQPSDRVAACLIRARFSGVSMSIRPPQ